MSEALRFGVVGRDISYSRSGDIFRAAFDAMEIDGTFSVYSVDPNQLAGVLGKLRAGHIDGLLVTIPYKEAVIPYLDRVESTARSLGTVNCIRAAEGILTGYNTDWRGFGAPLRRHDDVLRDGEALILGCGGAAKAALYGLRIDFGVKRFVILGRSPDRLFRFKQRLENMLGDVRIRTAIDADFAGEAPQKYAIAVNATPVGGWNHLDEDPLPIGFDLSSVMIYYDLNYNSGNAAVKRAEKAGLTAIDGSRMLVDQALRSLEVWTGRTVPFERVYDSVFGAR
jgi:shikimate dehydrogenase